MQVTVAGALPGNTDLTLTANRESAPASYTQSYETTETVPVGTYTVTVRFYSDANATGSVVAEASAPATLASDGSGLDTLTVGGKLASLELTAPATLVVGDTSAPLLVTARTASNQILAVTPGSFRFQVQSGDAVTLTSDARLSAVKPGTASVVALLDSLVSPARSVLVQATGGVDVDIR